MVGVGCRVGVAVGVVLFTGIGLLTVPGVEVGRGAGLVVVVQAASAATRKTTRIHRFVIMISVSPRWGSGVLAGI